LSQEAQRRRPGPDQRLDGGGRGKDPGPASEPAGPMDPKRREVTRTQERKVELVMSISRQRRGERGSVYPKHP